MNLCYKVHQSVMTMGLAIILNLLFYFFNITSFLKTTQVLHCTINLSLYVFKIIDW